MATASDPELNPNLVFVSEARISTVADGEVTILRDHWWISHPGKGLLFYDPRRMTPQCNRNPEITTRIRDAIYPWAEIRQVALVCLRATRDGYAIPAA